MNQMTIQETLDSKIHKTIQDYCDATKHPIRVEQALLAFDFLSKSASKSEIRAHKGEYLFLFRRLISSLPSVPVRKGRHSFKTETEQYTPKIIELTDWFIAQRGREDGLYKNRLKTLLQVMDEKNLPVSAKKRQTWQECLMPKKRISLRNLKVVQPETVYHFGFYGRGLHHKLGDKD